MKQLITLLLFFCFIASDINAQKSDTCSSHIDITAAYINMLSPDGENSITSVAGNSGFLGILSYGQTIDHVGLLVSGYMKLHSAADKSALQPLYKDGWDVNSFTSDAYFSSGVLVGATIFAQKYGDLLLPDFYFNLQAGICNVRIPEHDYEFLIPDGGGGTIEYKKNYTATYGIGSAVNVSVEADLMRSQSATYNVKLGMLMENANPLIAYRAVGGDPYVVNGYERFAWTSIYAYFGVSVKFGL